MSALQRAVNPVKEMGEGVASGTRHVDTATNAEKGAWGWLILDMPPFVWAVISIILYITAITADHSSGSPAAFVFGIIFSFVYMVALSKHKTGKSFPI